jgi:hypothetical protein
MEEPIMICPNCLANAELVYSAMSGGLVCLTPDCTWERTLDEDETFELFFGFRTRANCETAERPEALVHEQAF